MAKTRVPAKSFRAPRGDLVSFAIQSRKMTIMYSRLSRSPLSFHWNALIAASAFALPTAPALAADATNVTSVVAAAVKDNKLAISASNGTFTDTAPGIPK
jgi:hypothetical protein